MSDIAKAVRAALDAQARTVHDPLLIRQEQPKAVILARPALPVLSSEADIMRFVAEDCGADGFTIDLDRMQLVALRFNADGTARRHKVYDVSEWSHEQAQ